MTPTDPADDPAPPSARECVFAVSVLESIDLIPSDAGPVVPGLDDVLIPWPEIEDAIAGVSDQRIARARVSALIRLRTLISDLGDCAAQTLTPSLRLLALPPGHPIHPGPGWVRRTVLGGALDVGFGIVDVLANRSDCVPVPATLNADLHLGGQWEVVVDHADRMAQICAERLRRDARDMRLRDRIQRSMPASVIRPVGGVDVPSLLATRTLRAELAGRDPSGSRLVAVPMRNRGWFDTTRTDPVFVGSAWVATPELERGLPTVLLVTADEVVSPAAPVIDLTTLEERPGPVLTEVDAQLDRRKGT